MNNCQIKDNNNDYILMDHPVERVTIFGPQPLSLNLFRHIAHWQFIQYFRCPSSYLWCYNNPKMQMYLFMRKLSIIKSCQMISSHCFGFLNSFYCLYIDIYVLLIVMIALYMYIYVISKLISTYNKFSNNRYCHQIQKKEKELLSQT